MATCVCCVPLGPGLLVLYCGFYSHFIDFKELKVEGYLNVVVVIRLLIVVIVL